MNELLLIFYYFAYFLFSHYREQYLFWDISSSLRLKIFVSLSICFTVCLINSCFLIYVIGISNYYLYDKLTQVKFHKKLHLLLNFAHNIQIFLPENYLNESRKFLIISLTLLWESQTKI